MEFLGDNISRLRQDLSLTQKEMANYVGTTQQSISKIENNSKLPDVILLCKIADLFQVSIDDLIYNPRVNIRSKPQRFSTTISNELLELLKYHRSEVDLMVEFLIFRKKLKEKQRK